MTFKLYTDDGKIFGPYGSLPLAQKQARAKLAEHKLRKVIEIRPALAGAGPFSKRTKGSVYRFRDETPDPEDWDVIDNRICGDRTEL